MELEEYKDKSKEELIAEIEQLKNRYGLVWKDHDEDVMAKIKSNIPILDEIHEKAIISDPQNPTNILIEGDNYHALTVLQYTHQGKVDVIVIDPPYNRGKKDFRYNDQYIMEDDAYRHSLWLSFMDKRLRLARNLLKESGVIFIHIDDNEFYQLKLLCDSVFGEKQFVCSIPWNKRASKTDVPYNVSQDYEWILVYANPKFLAGRFFERRYYESDDLPGKPWRFNPITKQCTAIERPNSDFTIVNPKNGDEFPVNPNRVWCITKDTFPIYLEQNKIIFPGDYPFLNNSQPLLRVFKKDDEKKRGDDINTTSVSSKLPEEVGNSGTGTKEIIDLFGSKVFSFPKPTSLIKYLLKITNNPNAIVLDFFAGSGTTGHAVLGLNAEDGGNRQFILCTNNENNICEEVTYERIKKAIKGYTTPKDEYIEGVGGNLRYFRCEYMPKSESKDQNKLNMRNHCTEILCIHENVFENVANGDKYRIFKNANKIIGIYFDYADKNIENAINILKTSQASQKILYCFSMSGNINSSMLGDELDGIRVKGIPQQIIDIYQSHFRK